MNFKGLSLIGEPKRLDQCYSISEELWYRKSYHCLSRMEFKTSIHLGVNLAVWWVLKQTYNNRCKNNIQLYHILMNLKCKSIVFFKMSMIYRIWLLYSRSFDNCCLMGVLKQSRHTFFLHVVTEIDWRCIFILF